MYAIKKVHNIQKKRMKLQLGIALVMTALVLILRVVLMPLLRDPDTGRFMLSAAILVPMALAVAVLAVIAFFVPRERVDIAKGATVSVSLTALFAGAMLAIETLWDAFNFVFYRTTPAPASTTVTGVSGVVLGLLFMCGIGGGVYLVLWGMQLASEDGTRVGMGAWGALLPVLWVWMRLARYEMSYASAAALTDVFYDFLMLIFEMLFLFKMARFVSGIGKTTPGGLMFLSLGTALFTLTGTLTRVAMYLMQDTTAYLSSELAGFSDFAIGLMALAFASALCKSVGEIPQPSEESASGDGSSQA